MSSSESSVISLDEDAIIVRLDSVVNQMDVIREQLKTINDHCANLTALLTRMLAKGGDEYDAEDSE